MTELINYLNTIYPLSDGLKYHLTQKLKVKEVPKKTLLLKAGHICRNIYFVQKGLLRSYYKKDTKDVSAWFMTEGNMVISVESFYQQKESYEYIQALEDTVVYYIDYNELKHINHHYPEFRMVVIELTEKYYILSEQRIRSMRSMKAAERYAYLKQRFPEIVERVTSKYIASYIGVAEATLSKIKSKM
jgi:CRP/FNR family transcriptional regulator, anaerobic regulatory protein